MTTSQRTGIAGTFFQCRFTPYSVPTCIMPLICTMPLTGNHPGVAGRYQLVYRRGRFLATPGRPFPGTTVYDSLLILRPGLKSMRWQPGQELKPWRNTLQAECVQDPTLTVLSVDGVGAYDLISRKAMREAIQAAPDACSIFLFVRLFYLCVSVRVDRRCWGAPQHLPK